MWQRMSRRQKCGGSSQRVLRPHLMFRSVVRQGTALPGVSLQFKLAARSLNDSKQQKRRKGEHEVKRPELSSFLKPFPGSYTKNSQLYLDQNLVLFGLECLEQRQGHRQRWRCFERCYCQSVKFLKIEINKGYKIQISKMAAQVNMACLVTQIHQNYS